MALLIMAIVASIGSALLSAPLVIVAVRRYARTGQALHRRALLLSLVNSAVQGVGAAVLGFLFAAGIGDERAGEAVLLLAGGGLVGGAIVAFLPSYVLIVVGCKLHDRRVRVVRSAPPRTK